MLYEHAGQCFVWFIVVSFVVTGGRGWSFQTLNLEVFKTEQENCLSLSQCADSVASHQILCLKNI